MYNSESPVWVFFRHQTCINSINMFLLLLLLFFLYNDNIIANISNTLMLTFEPAHCEAIATDMSTAGPSAVAPCSLNLE